MANWFKFYGIEYLSDPKMMALTAAERSCWITLLCQASIFEDGGRVKYLTEERLMIQSGIELTDDAWKDTIGIFEKFKKLKMITESNGEVMVINWNKRQETFLTNAERQARYRERHSNTKVTTESNRSNAREEKKREEENREDTILNQEKIKLLFDQFWDLYPNKVAKKRSLQAWNKIKLNEKLFQQIIQSLKAHKKSERWGKGIIPHPTTWLNQERWEEVLEEKKVEVKEELFIPSYAKKK